MQRNSNNRGRNGSSQIGEYDAEQMSLLADDDEQDLWAEDQPCPPNPHSNLPVYNTIHRVRQDIITSIDDPYSLEQLRSPRMNLSTVRPLVDKFYDMKDISIIYCLLVNRVQFLREQTYQSHHQSVNMTRGLLCELLANRVLRRYDEDNPGRRGLLLLANILVAGFEPFQNAPDYILQENKAFHWAVQVKGGYERKSTALEVGIISGSKTFLSSSACQKIVDAIYHGRIVYTPSSFMDILPDHYKHKPITLYDPRKAPLLNQYRLSVPRTRNVLDVFQFLVLLVLYVLTMENQNNIDLTTYEIIFIIYAFGWVLEEFGSILEHGWQIYTQNLWSFLDFAFAVLYAFYVVLRIQGAASGNVKSSQTALDILSSAAPVLIPRLAFNLLPENMLFVSLRAMMADFAVLSVLAVWCFGGFLLSMIWLSDGYHQAITISKWMLWVWFGLDGTGIQRSVDFHWLLGPVLMVTFAFLGNTLFLTILVSMLSNTFSNIVSNATAEIQFRRAVLTFEGVKSDAIFAYQPPFNVLALCILLPLKCVLSPRWFHKINVTGIRILNAPLLLAISAYERRSLWATVKRKPYRPSRLGILLSPWDFSRFSVHGDIQAVFDSDVPIEVLEEVAAENNLRPNSLENGNPGRVTKRPGTSGGSTHQKTPSRRESIGPFAGLTEHLTEILQDHSGSDVQERLQKVEASTKRIEELLEKLCGDEENEATGG